MWGADNWEGYVNGSTFCNGTLFVQGPFLETSHIWICFLLEVCACCMCVSVSVSVSVCVCVFTYMNGCVEPVFCTI